MSELRSVLDQLGATAADALSNSELAAEIVETVHAQQMLDVLIAGWTKTLADRDGHAELGYPSPTAFLTPSGPHVGRSRQTGRLQGPGCKQGTRRIPGLGRRAALHRPGPPSVRRGRVGPRRIPGCRRSTGRTVGRLVGHRYRQGGRILASGRGRPRRTRPRETAEPARLVLVEDHQWDAASGRMAHCNCRRSLRGRTGCQHTATWRRRPPDTSPTSTRRLGGPCAGTQVAPRAGAHQGTDQTTDSTTKLGVAASPPPRKRLPHHPDQPPY